MTELVVSPIPKAMTSEYEKRMRLMGTVLYRALKAKGADGLAWRECFVVLDGFDNVMVGRVIIWLRSKGVSITSSYASGETVFVLEEPLLPPVVAGGDGAWDAQS